jgi:hypothetical protein
MDAEQNGSERMAEITTTLSVVGQSLADLAVRLASATADEIPTLADDARISVRRITACCMDTGPLEHFTPDDAAAFRAGLIQLADILQAQIVGIIDLRWAQLTSGGGSRSRH